MRFFQSPEQFAKTSHGSKINAESAECLWHDFMLSNFHAFPDPRPYCLGRSLRHRNDRWLRLVLCVAYPKTQCDLAEVESSRIIKQWSNVFRWNIPKNQIINQICLNYVMIHQPEMCSHLGIRNDPHNEHNRNHFQSRDLNKDGSFKYGWTIQFWGTWCQNIKLQGKLVENQDFPITSGIPQFQGTNWIIHPVHRWISLLSVWGMHMRHYVYVKKTWQRNIKPKRSGMFQSIVRPRSPQNLFFRPSTNQCSICPIFQHPNPVAPTGLRDRNQDASW